ncbi:hypothetical protein OIU84_005026 [Salix udensis]|uniref:DUF3456 domain-containing protein n=1 Tax=Salix udensis TaxID=889485 RepID=A0AAD6JVW7_9ROSI|nr:hypothetical protein OIU84_005026 [Salix udensis]
MLALSVKWAWTSNSDTGLCLRRFLKLDSPVNKKQETRVRGAIGATKMAESTAWLFLMIFFVFTFTVVSSIDDKCAACNAVAEEIENGLSNEKPRNHLDMRHRLDSKGQRRGKVIDYRWIQKDMNGLEWIAGTVLQLTSKKPKHIQKIYHLIVEGYWRKLKMSWQNG